ncbi:MAG: hypothetical protein PHR96_00015 [Clostridia bacterium]|nr:hypothetical protein [Clostridia bacterium]
MSRLKYFKNNCFNYKIVTADQPNEQSERALAERAGVSRASGQFQPNGQSERALAGRAGSSSQTDKASGR